MRFAAYVVYHEDQKTELLRECLIPAALGIGKRPGVESVHLQRHWKQGPHVRICVRASDPQVRESVARDELRFVNSYLESHPSTAVLDEEAYRKTSEFLGALEIEPPPYEPVWPDNTVHMGEYDPRSVLLGGEEALAFKEDFLEAALRPMLALLEATQGSDSLRQAYALSILTMLANSYPGRGILRGHMSLKSHLEDFLFDYDPGERLRDTFEQRYHGTRERALLNLRRVIDEMEDDRYVGGDPLLRKWWELFERGWDRALDLAERREIREDPGAEQLEAAQRLPEDTRGAAIRKYIGDPARTSYSPFHTELQKLSWLPKRANLVSFSAYRWLVNLTYSVLPMLGVSPIERYYLCYVLTETTYEYHDTSWEDVFKSIRSEWSDDL